MATCVQSFRFLPITTSENIYTHQKCFEHDFMLYNLMTEVQTQGSWFAKYNNR